MISPRWKYFNKIFSSELLRKDGSSGLLNNFHKFLSLKKSPDDRQQDLYTAVLCRPKSDRDRPRNFSSILNLNRKRDITLTRTDNTEVKVAAEPLLSCVRGSRIPIRDIKTIKAKLMGVKDWMWDVFSLLTSGGAVIEEIQCQCSGSVYCAIDSSVIHEMIQQGKLLELR